MKKKFKKGSAFETSKFNSELDYIEERLGKVARDKEEYRQDVHDLEETDKDTGPEYVMKQEGEKVAQAKAQKDEAANYLDMAYGHDSYRINLAEWGMWLLMKKEFPDRFDYHCVPTKDGQLNVYGKMFHTQDGILFVLKSPDGRVFAKAMSCSYMPEVDVHAAGLIAVEMENTVDHLKGILLDK